MTGIRRIKGKACAMAVLVLWSLAFTGFVLAEPVYMGSSATGLYEPDGESVLQVEGLEGWINIRAGGKGQVRFRSTRMADRDVEVPLEMWKDGQILLLRPENDIGTVGVRMEAAVPPGFSLVVLLNDTELTLANIYGDITLRGERIDAKVFGVEGDVELLLHEGKARLQNITGDLDVDLKAADVHVDGVSGRFDAVLDHGRLEAANLAGPVELNGEDAEVVLGGNADTLRVHLSGGSLQTTGAQGGGEFGLSGTPLALKECRGDIRVETDAAISFTDCTADLHFDTYGSSVNGTGNEGILEVKTADAEVRLGKINGPTRIQGDRLNVDIKEAGGELWILGVSSNIKVDNINSPLKVENEFGDVHVMAATKMVEVHSLDGNVTIERQSGPVAVSAKGDQVTVTWTSVNWGENSVVENTSGDVTLYLPKLGGCVVDAGTSYGRIETDIEEIVVEDDGRKAAGSFNRAKSPILRVRAEGDLRIMQAPVLE